MRQTFVVAMFGTLLVVGACGDDSSDTADGEIESQEDVQQLFEAVMPDLVAALTEFANSQQPAFLARDKGADSSVQCQEGGAIVIDTGSGQSTLTSCTVRGIVINAELELFVQPTGPSSYQASFSGELRITGTFFGTIEVISAQIQWSDPPSVDNTFWTVTVLLRGQTITVTSGAAGGGACGEIFGSAPGYTLCQEDSQSCGFYVVLNETSCDDSCRSFGRTCLSAFSDTDDNCPPGEVRPCNDPAGDRICFCSKN